MERLEQIYRNGLLEPSIANIRIRAVPIENQGHVIIVRIPRSFIPPHRIKLHHNNGFWARGDTQKYELNVEQLRRMFNDAPHFSERIRSFQADRLIKINAGDTPLKMRSHSKMVVHLVPVPSFANDGMVDIVSVLKNEPVLRPMKNRMPNLDGYLHYIASQVCTDEECLIYTQFFRNGAIEHVSEFFPDSNSIAYELLEPHFHYASSIKTINSIVVKYLAMPYFRERGFPVYIFLSFCNAAKLVCFYKTEDGFKDKKWPIDREIVPFPAIRVDSHDVDVPTIMQPIFNMVANAFKLEQFNT